MSWMWNLLRFFVFPFLGILGVPGIPESLQTWSPWIAKLDSFLDPWFVRTALFFIAIAGLTYPQWLPSLWKRFTPPLFDMLISDAIDHVVKSGLSEPSYASELYVETRAARAIFNLAVENKVRLAGRLPEADYPSLISGEVLRELKPIEMVVPRSNRYPEGRCWALVPVAHLDSHKEHSMDQVYSDLKVCSRDIYQTWPPPLDKE